MQRLVEESASVPLTPPKTRGRKKKEKPAEETIAPHTRGRPGNKGATKSERQTRAEAKTEAGSKRTRKERASDKAVEPATADKPRKRQRGKTPEAVSKSPHTAKAPNASGAASKSSQLTRGKVPKADDRDPKFSQKSLDSEPNTPAAASSRKSTACKAKAKPKPAAKSKNQRPKASEGARQRKRKSPDEMTPEEAKKSRKSSAYHMARQKCIKLGLDDEEAKRRGKAVFCLHFLACCQSMCACWLAANKFKHASKAYARTE